MAQIVSAILFETPAPLHDIAPDAPDGLDFVIKRALEKIPASRWRSGAELRQALALCRLTLGMAGAPAPRTDEKSEIQDLAKTVVVARPKAQPATPPVAPPVAPPITRLPEPVPPPLIVPRKLVSPAPPPPAREYTYCPSCTARNAQGAAVCTKCGVPLTSLPDPLASSPTRLGWGVLIGVAALAVLLFLLIVVYASNTR